MSREPWVSARKKPVVIRCYKTSERIEIKTLEGTMVADAGDYVIEGVEGERYPCKPDIFQKTYDIIGISENQTP